MEERKVITQSVTMEEFMQLIVNRVVKLEDRVRALEEESTRKRHPGL